MKQVVVGSKNPVKLNTTKESFEALFDEAFEFLTHDAPSGVPDQPMSDTETLQGAINRAYACKEEHPHADYFVGLEGGLEKIDGDYQVFAWMFVLAKDGTTSKARAATFTLPQKISALIDAGEELGHATDIIFNEHNSKHKGGTVAILTNDLVTRKDYYKMPLMFALSRFIKPELY